MKLTLLIITLAALSSCQTKVHKTALVEINIGKNVANVKPLYISDYGGELRYVPLKGNIQLKTIILTDFYQDLMLVTDRFTCVLCDLEGNMITKIGNRGKGPGEYNLILSMKFGIDGQVLLQDSWYISEYDQQGNFIRKFNPEVNPEKDQVAHGGTMFSWAPFNDSLYIGQICNDSGVEKNKAVFFNDKGETVRTVQNHIFLNKAQRYTSSTNSEADIYKLDGTTYFKEMMNDTVFRVSEQFGFEPVCFFNFGKYGLPKAVREMPIQVAAKEMQNYIYMNRIQETSRFFFLTCNFNNHNPARRTEPVKFKDVWGNETIWWFYTTMMLGIYDKRAEELVFAEPAKTEERLTNSGLKNDYDGGVNFQPRVPVDDNTMAMWVDAYELRDHVISRVFRNSTPKNADKKKKLEKLVNNLSENDNPVMILCTFKK